LEDYCECTDLPKDDTEPYSIRVGWSIAQSSLQLGENQYSFSFCNNGKKCHDKTFEDYGAVLDKGDSIAAYIVKLNNLFRNSSFKFFILFKKKRILKPNQKKFNFLLVKTVLIWE
jgi:hypothetical protein